MIYLQLFISFFKIGLFGFGGGLAILSLIQHEVLAYGWMSEQEFVDIVAISQVTPGPIGVVIMLTLCKLYLVLSTRFADNPYFQNTLRYLRFAVLGLIAAAALLLITPATFIDRWSVVLFAGVFVLTVLPQLIRSKRPVVKQIVTTLSHPILLIVLAGVAGYFIYR